ncbi:MAG: hypothetical protein HC767_11005, partial [Akkermansiaceae bacterium]|nr:hypothetical protein [Akkermansiaceae bacterium]
GGVRLGSFWWFPPYELHEFRHLLGAEAEAQTEYGEVPELISINLISTLSPPFRPPWGC